MELSNDLVPRMLFNPALLFTALSFICIAVRNVSARKNNWPRVNSGFLLIYFLLAAFSWFSLIKNIGGGDSMVMSIVIYYLFATAASITGFVLSLDRSYKGFVFISFFILITILLYIPKLVSTF